MKSISRKLLSLLLGGLLVTSVLTVASTYLSAREELDELFDYQLAQIAHAFANQESAVIPRDARYEEESELAIEVWKNGTLFSAIPGNMQLPLQREGYATIHVGGREWRVYVLSKGTRAIQVAQPVEARREVSASFALKSLLPLLFTLPLFALFIFISVRSGLRPLGRVAQEISRRSPSLLNPIPVGALPIEILPLVERLNLLLERLALTIETQKRFVADAAHELRTPLAAIGLQVRVLERSSGEAQRLEALERLKGGVERSARLVGQLLALARIEPESPRRCAEEVRLTALAREVVTERARLALEKGIDLGVAESEEVTVNGEEDALRALLGNLVDNAVRYTGAGGTVDVSVRRGGLEAVVEVTDTGPGVPADERERVFDRFYRRGGDYSGSGLGLAIVKSAAERHGGTVSLGEGENGRGLKVTVVIPCSQQPLGELDLRRG